jgi:hypothetical protein
MNLSVNDICKLQNFPNLLSELQHYHQKEINPSLRKTLRVYKGGKLKLHKQAQNGYKKVSNRNQRYADKRGAIRQELYGEVSVKELETIVDALIELESPNSFCLGDSKSE